jgi:hypothetical protein
MIDKIYDYKFTNTLLIRNKTMNEIYNNAKLIKDNWDTSNIKKIDIFDEEIDFECIKNWDLSVYFKYYRI